MRKEFNAAAPATVTREVAVPLKVFFGKVGKPKWVKNLRDL